MLLQIGGLSFLRRRASEEAVMESHLQELCFVEVQATHCVGYNRDIALESVEPQLLDLVQLKLLSMAVHLLEKHPNLQDFLSSSQFLFSSSLLCYCVLAS